MSGLVNRAHAKSMRVNVADDSAKVYVRFNNSAGVDIGYNVSSVVDINTGHWRVNFLQQMAHNHYVCTMMCQSATTPNSAARVTSQQRSYCDFKVYDNNSPADFDPNHMVVHSRQK